MLLDQHRSRIIKAAHGLIFSSLLLRSVSAVFPANEQIVMVEDELIAKLTAARQLAERFNLDFEQILDAALRRLPPDSVKAICARLKFLPRIADGRRDESE
jgi:hypothetical protein